MQGENGWTVVHKSFDKNLLESEWKFPDKYAKYENAKPLHNKQWFKGLEKNLHHFFQTYKHMHVQVKNCMCVT